jgi:hypothetical protein
MQALERWEREARRRHVPTADAAPCWNVPLLRSNLDLESGVRLPRGSWPPRFFSLVIIASCTCIGDRPYASVDFRWKLAARFLTSSQTYVRVSILELSLVGAQICREER